MRPANIGNSFMSPWMCVWQSHAFAGTSKFTRVAGCAALASSEVGKTARAVPPIRTSRRVSIGSPLVDALFALDAGSFDDRPPFFNLHFVVNAKRFSALLLARWNLLAEVGKPLPYFVVRQGIDHSRIHPVEN